VTWDRATSPDELVKAVDALDQRRVRDLCAALVIHLGHDETPYPVRQARRILRTLRGKRYFRDLREVADAFLQAGATDATIRRQYAQALLDQGILTAAVAVLEDLLADPGGSASERGEARGLLGRAYKQMYLRTSPTPGARGRLIVERAMAEYRRVYEETGSVWHGINVVALLHRARHDGLDLPGDPRALAQQILDSIDEFGPAASTWDHGTAVEACLALGDAKEVLARLDAYLDQRPGPFEIASLLRQVREVWGLDVTTPPGTHVIPLLHAALLLRRKGADISVGPDEMATLDHVDDEFERVLGTERFESLRWYRTGLERCRAVARVEDALENGQGTGFLVDGPALHPSFPPVVLVTNAHVLATDAQAALRPDEARITFRALDTDNGPFHVTRVLWTSPPHELDTTVVELDNTPRQSTRCPLAAHRPLLDVDPPPRAYVIGHPGGTEQPMFSLRDNRLLDHDDALLHYRTPTEHGSSGSPVFNRLWEVIALHHKGGKTMRRLNGTPGTYPANEGVWLDRIKQEIAAALD